jgi:hypothetical protein
MKNISYWASCHVTTARLLIICIKFFLTATAYYTGITLYKMQVILPSNIIYSIAFFVLLIIIAAYPSKRRTVVAKKFIYIRQKTCDFILPLSSFLVIATMVNNSDVVPASSGAYGSAVIKHPTVQQILASGKTKESLTGKEKRVLKKEFFKQLKNYTAATLSGDKDSAGKAWKIILAIIAAVGLLYLLAALVCSLSCGGSDAAAIIVGVLGLAGIIWGLVALIKRIQRGPKQPKPE